MRVERAPIAHGDRLDTAVGDGIVSEELEAERRQDRREFGPAGQGPQSTK
jgi:hypothetical protein